MHLSREARRDFFFFFICKIFWMLSKRESQAREAKAWVWIYSSTLTPLHWQADKHFTYWPFKTRLPIPQFNVYWFPPSQIRCACRSHALPVGNYLGYYHELNISHVYWIEYILRGSNGVLSCLYLHVWFPHQVVNCAASEVFGKRLHSFFFFYFLLFKIIFLTFFHP